MLLYVYLGVETVLFPTDFQCHQIMVLTPKTPKIACLSSKTEAIMGNNTKQKAFGFIFRP